MRYISSRAFSPAPGVSVAEGEEVDWSESAARYYAARGWLRPAGARPPPAPPKAPRPRRRAKG